MKNTTYSGKEIECEIYAFRPLSSDEIKKYDDGTTKKFGELPGSGDLVCPRISEYYLSQIKINGELQSAFIHADDIIKSAAPNSVYCGYRMGSLNIFTKSESFGHWYNRRVDERDGETMVLGCSMSENLTSEQIDIICDHIAGVSDISEKVYKAMTDLISAKKYPAVSYKDGPLEVVFGDQVNPEESDKNFALRLCSLVDNYKSLLECKKQIDLELFKLKSGKETLL